MTPINQLKGIGVKVAEKLARLNIISIEDLLFHLPFRYQDRTQVYRIGDVAVGAECQVEGAIQHVQIVFPRRRMLEVYLRDDSGMVALRFFHFSSAQHATLKVGRKLRCFGEVRRGRKGLEMIHPEYQFADYATNETEAAYMPIYSTTEGLNQYSLRKFTGDALLWLQQPANTLEELLPSQMLTHECAQFSLKDAVQYIHRPPRDAEISLLQQGEHPAQKRLAFEEILAHTLSLKRFRKRTRRRKAFVLAGQQDLLTRFEQNLPFSLTAAQQRVIAELRSDLSDSQPMVRLIQGDVGSGKTVVAVAAMLLAVAAGKQAAVMVPTEVLADQFYQNLLIWLEPLQVNVCLITGKQKTAAARLTRRQARTGEARIIVGTHALFQDTVEFASLALLVIDEQHRFGVHQRLAFRQKGEAGDYQPHQLIMTATPIPRSLAMTLYADLDYSVIDEMPLGRQPTQTVVLPDSRRNEVIARVHEASVAQRQVFWVCPLIEESENLACRNAEQTFELLVQALPNLTIGLVHGRMKTEEKTSVVTAFRQGKIHLLVATTVIEVGVDVPRANLMIIENSERFGLAQLHQLRGRVGRGSDQAICVLLYQQPLSAPARARLDIMRKSNDGFAIAREDMKMRGFGEVLGTKQTGEMRFRIANLVRDLDVMENLPSYVDQLLKTDELRVDKLIARWLGNSEKYVEV